ncbi:5-methyltetrahydrofolate--homocysteine methyltransferase [Hydrogenimonas cancrithermarum]|uniref:Methionine synthase n=2 Tax=Hydrogenimonas cancrithermarum TaxID=2993563 RepID=A0ABN6WYC8_9BACT|nr:methionine synthase [Hydrogenimonas cancrithermarum]BDY13763.1 5-methyltetrahydrofolate--homocysteine methyltransferase [Hydrogenimonas cancrithermarum]
MVAADKIKELMEEKILVIDGAMGTQIQSMEIPDEAWEGKEGCNELLNATAPELIRRIHERYAMSGADLIKTNTFGAMDWVLDEYQIGDRAYELSKKGCELVKSVCEQYSTPDKPRFCLGSIGPGTKLPSLKHIEYDEMYAGYYEMAEGMIDGGVDIFLLETCQDPLQIKAALHACQDAAKEKGVRIPVMVSVTIELSGSMLIGTDAGTIATIMEPFEILSLGFNCGTGPEQVEKHVKTLSQLWHKPISVHANAGLPQNRGGYTYYPMGPEEFSALQKSFTKYDGVTFLGGCCGTTPQHIKALCDAVEGVKPRPASGSHPASLASLFNSVPLMQDPPPLLIGERSNATGSKAFRELLLAEDYEGTLTVGQQQVRAGAHVLDVSVGFAGRDETKDMHEVISLYAQKIPLPLMPDSTQVKGLETALKCIGGKPILNSVNLEDGIEKFDAVCRLAKRYGASLVCLTIDETGMAKTVERKLEVAERIYKLATEKHGIRAEDLVFDVLTFTVGSGDEEYRDAAVQTIEAIRELRRRHPEVGATLGLSNISFGLDKDARPYLNSVFLHHCLEAGLTSVIINVKHIIPMNRISKEDRKVCEDLLFDNREEGDPLFKFIEHFSKKEAVDQGAEDEAYLKMSDEEKIHKLLLDGDKDRMIPLVEEVRHRIAPEKIVNEILIEAMKVVGELFGSGQMQLPFVLQSAETMKAAVDHLNPYLPKKEKASDTTLVLGTVKGDVHDVGKNLVDIILTNNGFKVVNLGIKVELEQFLEAAKEYNADAIGFSGLLVKSTQVMKENLELMREKGVDIPILMGGAALTKGFVDDYCRPIYKGPIFYCRDAFDGVIAMSRIEEGNFDTRLASDGKEEEEIAVPKKKEVVIPPLEEIPMPSREVKVPVPPFWGRRVMTKADFDPAIAFEWLNHRILFKSRWGYRSKGMTKEAYEKQLDEVVRPAYERLKAQFLDEGLFEPTIIYGYYPCRGDDTTLLVFDESEGWSSDKDANREPLEEVIGRAREAMTFPRQTKKPWRCLADYFHSDRHDVVAFTTVSAGSKISEYERKLYDEGKFHEYYLVHGLGVELAEALAEVAHKQIRLDLNIADKEGHTLRDVEMRKYQGARYSPGYPACPDLELNKPIFDLLKPEDFGIELSETFQIHPEQSTAAIVVYHPEAMYYSI